MAFQAREPIKNPFTVTSATHSVVIFIITESPVVAPGKTEKYDNAFKTLSILSQFDVAFTLLTKARHHISPHINVNEIESINIA